jgi:hypothetical protein
MSVTLTRPYLGFASGAVVTLADDTEAALIAQGLATAKDTDTVTGSPPGTLQQVTLGGNVALFNQGGQSTPSVRQGRSKVPNTPLGAVALTTYDTNGSVHVAGTLNIAEIQVDANMLVTGIGILNGTTVGTDKWIGALYGSDGTLLRKTDTAGTTTAGASTFQQIAFETPIVLVPGRYFVAVQCNGTTDTSRKILSANQPNTLTTSVAGVFGTIPATIAVPTTHTTAVGVICWLYT